ncbi:glycosyltransferase family 2 protein [Novosphingobium humi]|uniref:Glycosyltransferase family 2 protein n=1 Tax=Novosphingobium humi TaxID=2282397 RepID=A0ABY7TZM3_9SPHN|nr:glycosyltransferase family 2 protein [Novosphingobium humi]WCT77259.1 glycosyltransferase family 2 protein [Novosphingobium humi]
MPSASSTLDLTVLILTYNEARHIERSIASVKHFAREIVVVDSHSTDNTVELAQKAGARVLFNPFINYSKQFQWGLDNGGITSEWVMRLDADEIIEPDLGDELIRAVKDAPADVVGMNMDRKHIFMGRWVRHGGRYPLRLLRVWRRNNGRIEDRWMDEHIVIWGGRTINLKGGFADCNLNDLTFFTEKHNKYATREAIDKLSQKYRLFEKDEAFSEDSGPRQAVIKRFVKEQVYNRLPFWAGPFGYFLYRYFVQLGFLDGYQGLIYHFLQGCWYRFLVEAKTIELDEAIRDCHTNDERVQRLTALTKLSLGPTR